MSTYQAATAGIRLVPILPNFHREARTKIEAKPLKATVQLVPELSANFAAEAAAKLARVRATLPVQMVPDFTGFATDVRARLTAMGTLQLNVGLTVTTVEFRRFVDELTIRLAAANLQIPIGITLDDAGYRAQLALLTRPVDQTVNINTRGGGAAGGLGGGGDRDGRGIGGLAGSVGKIAGATAAVGALTGAVGLAGGAIGGLAVGFVGLGAAAAGAGVVAALGMDGIKAAAKTITPEFDALKSNISSTFEQGLTPAMAGVGQMMTELTGPMQGVAASMSGVASQALNVATSAGGIEQLSGIFNNLSGLIDATGPGLQSLVSGFLTMGEAMGPQMEAIGSSIGNIFGSIGDTLTRLTASGALEDLFAGFATALDGIGPLISGLLEAFVTMGAQVLPVLGPLFETLGATLVQIGPALGEIGAAFGEAFTAILPTLGELISSLATGLAPIMPVLADLFKAVGQALIPVIEPLSKVAQVIGEALAQAITALAPAIGPLADAFASIVTALSPIIPVIAEVIGMFVEALAPALTTIFDALAPVIEQLAVGLRPVFDALAPVLAQVAGMIADALVQAITALAPLLPPLLEAFGGLLQALLPIIPPLIDIALQLLPPFVEVLQAILPAVTTIIDIFTDLVNLLMPVLIPAIEAVGSIVGSVFGAIGDTITGAINGVVIPVLDTLGTVVSGVGDFFEGLGDIASRIWDGITEGFKGAINYIIRGWNGLDFTMPDFEVFGKTIGGFTVGVPDIPELASGGIAGRTRDGRLYGPGTGTSDSILGLDKWGMPTALVSTDEGVVKKTAMDNGGADLVTALNAGWVPPIALLRAMLPSLAGGGHVTGDQLNQFPRKEGLEGAVYDWGGVHWGDCSGAMSGIVNFAVGENPWGSRGATGNFDSWLGNKGLLPGLGPEGSLRIGWYNGGPGGGHTAGTLPDGTNVEMGGARGDGQVGGQAAGANDPMFTNHMHLPPIAFLGGNPAPNELGGGANSPQLSPKISSPGSSTTSPSTSSSSSSSSSTSSSSASTWSGIAGSAAEETTKGFLDFFGISDKLFQGWDSVLGDQPAQPPVDPTVLAQARRSVAADQMANGDNAVMQQSFADLRVRDVLAGAPVEIKQVFEAINTFNQPAAVREYQRAMKQASLSDTFG